MNKKIYILHIIDFFYSKKCYLHNNSLIESNDRINIAKVIFVGYIQNSTL